ADLFRDDPHNQRSSAVPIPGHCKPLVDRPVMFHEPHHQGGSGSMELEQPVPVSASHARPAGKSVHSREFPLTLPVTPASLLLHDAGCAHSREGIALGPKPRMASWSAAVPWLVSADD